MRPPRRLTGSVRALLLGAAGSFAIAAVHVVVIYVGAPAYLYFGATSLVPLAESGSASPALVTSGIALVFCLWGVYALSGAGFLFPLPLRRAVLWAIAGIYTLRGLVLVPDLLRLLRGAGYPLRQTIFSAVSLALGIVHAVGANGTADARTLR